MRRQLPQVAPAAARLARKIEALRVEVEGLSEADAKRFLDSGAVDAAILLARQTRQIRNIGNVTIGDLLGTFLRVKR